MKYCTEQQLFMYDIFIQNSFGKKKCCTKFHRKYPDNTVPCKAMSRNIVTKLHSTGSMLDKINPKKVMYRLKKNLEFIFNYEAQRRHYIPCLFSFNSFLTRNMYFILMRHGSVSHYINSLKNGHLNTGNPDIVHEVPLYDVKVGIW
jgi:hypothetical protein